MKRPWTITFVGLVSRIAGGGEVFSPNAVLPSGSITLFHESRHATEADLDIETVTNSEGKLLYINLPPTERNVSWMRKNKVGLLD